MLPHRVHFVAVHIIAKNRFEHRSLSPERPLTVLTVAVICLPAEPPLNKANVGGKRD